MLPVRIKAGRAQMEFLKQNSISISHYNNIMINVSKVQEESMEIKEYVVELKWNLTDARKELALCQEAVKHMNAQLKVVSERDEIVNKTSPYDSIGAKQKKRKLVQFKIAAEADLWFSESFGLVPTELTAFTSTSDEAITIPHGDDPALPPD